MADVTFAIQKRKDFTFCSGCGEKIDQLRSCPGCGDTIFGDGVTYCPLCGYDTRDLKTSRSTSREPRRRRTSEDLHSIRVDRGPEPDLGDDARHGQAKAGVLHRAWGEGGGTTVCHVTSAGRLSNSDSQSFPQLKLIHNWASLESTWPPVAITP